MTIRTGDNNFAPSQFIVDGTAGSGTHTTIAAALSDASSGDTIFVKPGTYTEDLTLVAGVNITAYSGDALTPNVNIVGNATATFAGTCTISNISLTTNSSAFITVSGSSATIVWIDNCYLDISDNDGIVFSSSDSGAELTFVDCQGDIGTTGIKIFDHSSAGFLQFRRCYIFNSGGSTTASTASAGTCEIDWCIIKSPITTSGTSSMDLFFTNLTTGSITSTAWTVGGSGSTSANNCIFPSSTATPISVSSSVTLRACNLVSSNSTLIGGTGSVIYTTLASSSSGAISPSGGTSGASTFTGGISFDDGTNFLANFVDSTSWTPGLAFGGGTTGLTYTTQSGTYTRIGNIVFIYFNIVLSAVGSSTGGATLTGLPITAVASPTIAIPVNKYSLLTYASSRDSVAVVITGSSTTGSINMYGNNIGVLQLTDANFANTTSISGNGFYFV